MKYSWGISNPVWISHHNFRTRGREKKNTIGHWVFTKLEQALHGIAVLETGGSAVCDAGMGDAGAPGGEMALVFGFRHRAADDGDLEVFEVVAIDNFIVRLYNICRVDEISMTDGS